MARRRTEPIRITTATRSHSADLWSREKRYMITMGIRTACFLIAILSFVANGPRVVTWAFVIGSLVLPYIAVVMANAGSSPDPANLQPFDGDTGKKAIDPPSAPEEP
jgi:hypothetical protein